jgi:hypothetical protein
MKRAAPHDAGAAHSDDRRHIPHVIRKVTDGARERRPPFADDAGYGPAVPLQMALAHRCAPYDDVVHVNSNWEPSCLYSLLSIHVSVAK